MVALLITNIIHPLQIGERVKSRIPACAYRVGKWTIVTGTIKKINDITIRGQQKYSYILDTGHKINQDWVSNVL